MESSENWQPMSFLGIYAENKKEVLTIQVSDNENPKYWLPFLNEQKIAV